MDDLEHEVHYDSRRREAQAGKAPLLKGKSRRIVWHINLFGKKVKSSCFKTP